MRFSDRLTFVKETAGGYNPDTGRHEQGALLKTTKPCKLSNLGTERTNEIFGEINIKIVVARLQRPYREPFDYVMINNQKYTPKRQSDYRKGVFYLEGVGANGKTTISRT